jgi:hypothetical protein
MTWHRETTFNLLGALARPSSLFQPQRVPELIDEPAVLHRLLEGDLVPRVQGLGAASRIANRDRDRLGLRVAKIATEGGRS